MQPEFPDNKTNSAQRNGIRVVHISTRHNPLDSRIYSKECRTLSSAGYDVHYCVRQAPSFNSNGVHFHNMPYRDNTIRPQRILARMKWAYKVARKLSGHLYHIHDPELVMVGVWLKLAGAKVVYDVHEDNPQRQVWTNIKPPFKTRAVAAGLASMEKIAQKTFNAFVCATDSIASNFPPNRTITIRNYSVTREFNECNTRNYLDRPNNAVYLGTIATIRATREMSDAVGKLPPELNAKLVLAGRSADPGSLAIISGPDAPKHIEFKGWLDREMTIALLDECKVGLVILYPLKRYIVSLPIKLFEYMAAGIPVIASDFPLWRGIIEGADCGILIDPYNTDSIANSLRYLFENPERARQMGENGRKAARELYCWDTEGKRLVELYDSLLINS